MKRGNYRLNLIDPINHKKPRRTVTNHELRPGGIDMVNQRNEDLEDNVDHIEDPPEIDEQGNISDDEVDDMNVADVLEESDENIVNDDFDRNQNFHQQNNDAANDGLDQNQQINIDRQRNDIEDTTAPMEVCIFL